MVTDVRNRRLRFNPSRRAFLRLTSDVLTMLAVSSAGEDRTYQGSGEMRVLSSTNGSDRARFNAITADPNPKEVTLPTAIDVANRFYQATNNRSIDELRALVTDDVTFAAR